MTEIKKEDELLPNEELEIKALFDSSFGDDILNEKKITFEFEVSDNTKKPEVPKNKITLRIGIDEIIELAGILSLRGKTSLLSPQVVKITDKKNFVVSSTNSVMYHKAIATLTKEHNIVEGFGDLVIDWEVFIDKLQKRFNTTDHIGMMFLPDDMKWVCLRKPKTTTSINSLPYDGKVTWKESEFKEIKENGILKGFEVYNQQLFNWISVKASVLSSIYKICDNFGQSYVPLILTNTGELEVKLKGNDEISKGENFDDFIKIEKFYLESDRVESFYREGFRELLTAIPSEEIIKIYWGDNTPLVACLEGKRSGIKFSSKTMLQPYIERK